MIKALINTHTWRTIIRPHILRRDNHRCVKCNRLATEVDHIRPRCKGGTNEYSNLQSLCKKCHREKTLKDIAHLKYLQDNGEDYCEHGYPVSICLKCS